MEEKQGKGVEEGKTAQNNSANSIYKVIRQQKVNCPLEQSDTNSQTFRINYNNTLAKH